MELPNLKLADLGEWWVADDLLDAAKALSHPLRAEMLEALAGRERAALEGRNASRTNRASRGRGR
jgi:hypothetical protein